MLETLLPARRHSSSGKRQKQPSSSKGYRPDIQGLRALAVVLVVADHLFKWPAGGFIGVDVFFVLSGFLITGIMLREHAKTGRISFSDFYRRRVRRIMPVALLVLAVTLLFSALLFIGERTRSVLLDGLSSLVFASNWRFAATGTDYLQADGPVSPLQHYWSLAVEEQFYLLWPVLVVAVLVVIPRALPAASSHATKLLLLVTVALIASSFAFALWETSNAPTVAYFSTFSRAWELGIGALLAVASRKLALIPLSLRPALQWTGIGGVVISAFVIGPSSSFPGPWALLPVLSTALIIGGGVSAHSSPRVLDNPVSRYVGDISYSLYLWHFPAIVFLSTVVESSALVVLTSIVTMTLLSVLSFHFVENPLRNSQWLSRRGRKSAKPRFEYTQKHGLGLLALIMVPLVVMLGLIVERDARYSQAEYVAAPAITAPTAAEQKPSGIEQEINTALASTTFPELQPALEDLGKGNFDPADSGGCAPATPRGKDCSIAGGDPAKTAVVLGDSMAVAWLPSIRSVLEPKGWTVTAMTYVGCPFIAAETVADGEGITASCPEHRKLVRELVAETDPGLVVVSNAYGQRMVGAGGKPSQNAWTQGATIAHNEWLSQAERVVTLESPPAGANPTECITRLTSPQDCVSEISQTWEAYTQADRTITEAAGHKYIPTSSWFCGQQRCPLYVGDTVVRRDSTHMTPEYGRKIAPLLDEMLAPVLAS